MWAFFVGDFMTIQTVNLTVPGGDTPRSANTKINANFTDQTNAASKLVGPAIGQIPLAQDVHKASRLYTTLDYPSTGNLDIDLQPVGDVWTRVSGIISSVGGASWTVENIRAHHSTSNYSSQLAYSYSGTNFAMRSYRGSTSTWTEWAVFYNDKNTTKEPTTGYLKAASPILHLFNDDLVKEHEAVEQDITVDKLGTGDYLIKGSTGLSDEGWNLSPPKDIHGNVLCFVEATEADGNINVKTYKRKFDFDIVAIVADYDQPFDIPEGRSVDLRLNNLPTQPN